MDISTIAAATINILTPYLVKAGKEVATQATEAAWKKATEIYEAVKARFEQEKDDYPTQTMERYEENPEDRGGSMLEVLQEILKQDPDFARSLLTLLQEADESGAGTTFNVQIFGGEVGEIINIETLEGGLTIDKSNKPAKE